MEPTRLPVNLSYSCVPLANVGTLFLTTNMFSQYLYLFYHLLELFQTLHSPVNIHIFYCTKPLILVLLKFTCSTTYFPIHGFHLWEFCLNACQRNFFQSGSYRIFGAYALPPSWHSLNLIYMPGKLVYIDFQSWGIQIWYYYCKT